MQQQRTPESDTAAGLNTPAWWVSEVQALPDFTLAVVFSDGTQGIVHMKRLIHSEDAGIFARLRDPAIFAQLTINHGAVTWEGGVPDLAPDAMYRAIADAREWVL